MNEAEFEEEIDAADRKLAAQGMPVHQRSLRVFKMLASDYHGIVFGLSEAEKARFSKYEGPRLMQEIGQWYSKTYGRRAGFGGPIGHVPVVLRSHIYIANVPQLFGRLEVDVMSQIDGMTEHLHRLCTAEELYRAYRDWREGYELTYELRSPNHDFFLPKPGEAAVIRSRDLIESLFDDLEATRPALEAGHAPGVSLFHSQQLAEKSMKALLVSRGFDLREISNFGHDVNRLFEECSEFLEELTVQLLRRDVEMIAAIKMDVRYSPPEVSHRELADKFLSALRIGGAAMCALCHIARRRETYLKSELECAEPLRRQQLTGYLKYN